MRVINFAIGPAGALEDRLRDELTLQRVSKRQPLTWVQGDARSGRDHPVAARDECNASASLLAGSTEVGGDLENCTRGGDGTDVEIGIVGWFRLNLVAHGKVGRAAEASDEVRSA